MRRPRPSSLIVLFALLSVAGPVATSAAHEIRPAIATAQFTEDGRYEIGITANLEALLAGIGREHANTEDSPQAQTYDSLRRLPATQLSARIKDFAPVYLSGIEIAFDGRRVNPDVARIDVPAVGDPSLSRQTTIILAGRTPSGRPALTWRYDPKFGDSVFRAPRATDGKMAAFWLKNGERSPPIPVQGAPAAGFAETVGRYIVVGFTHILPLGLDHILFVLGLYLLSTRIRPLLIQVTNFTIAHTLSLALSMLGLVSISPSIVEPLIALSIVFVAVENWFTSRLQPWRPYVVFGFGLVHGLGFAGVLQEIGLESADFATSLISFNVGVELGQLAVIAAAYMAVGLWFGQKAWYRPMIVRPASVLIGVAGMIWFVERLV